MIRMMLQEVLEGFESRLGKRAWAREKLNVFPKSSVISTKEEPCDAIMGNLSGSLYSVRFMNGKRSPTTKEERPDGLKT